jgi:ATP-dependent Clp protease ATP-binding subunit ClpB
VLNALSKELLSGTINSNSIILMDAFDNGLVFRNQNEKIPKEL